CMKIRRMGGGSAEPGMKTSFSFASALPFAVFREDRMRFDKDEIENYFLFCLCARLSLSLEKTGCGSVVAKPKTSFSFATTLTFRYLCSFQKGRHRAGRSEERRRQDAYSQTDIQP